MDTYEFDTEAEAKEARRRWIHAGYGVSLIALNPENDKYTFDVRKRLGR